MNEEQTREKAASDLCKLADAIELGRFYPMRLETKSHLSSVVTARKWIHHIELHVTGSYVEESDDE